MPGDAQSIQLKPARSADPGSSLSSIVTGFRAANAPDPRLTADWVAQRGLMPALGRVSRASPVHTVMCNCSRDEGGPFGFDSRVLISGYRKLLWSKPRWWHCEKSRDMNPVR